MDRNSLSNYIQNLKKSTEQLNQNKDIISFLSNKFKDFDIRISETGEHTYHSRFAFSESNGFTAYYDYPPGEIESSYCIHTYLEIDNIRVWTNEFTVGTDWDPEIYLTSNIDRMRTFNLSEDLISLIKRKVKNEVQALEDRRIGRDRPPSIVQEWKTYSTSNQIKEAL